MAFTAPFLAWLAAAPGRRCLLAEVAVKVSGVEITRYLSTAGYTSAPADTPASQLYTGRISGGVQFTRRLDLAGSGGSMSFGDLELDNTDGALDTWKNDIWAGRAINLYLGEAGDAAAGIAAWAKSSFELVFSGTVDDIAPKARGKLSLKIRDSLGPLNDTLSTTVIGGTGDNKNDLQPITLGECFNITPKLLDPGSASAGVYTGASYSVFPAAPIELILEVRDNGISVSFSQASPNILGKFALTYSRYGTITCDAQGAKVAGAYRNDAGGLIEWIAKALVGNGNSITAGQIDATLMTAFRAACAQPVGLYIDSRANRLQVMQQLAAAVGATVTTTYDGKLQLVRVSLTGSPVGSIGTHNMVDGTFAPISRPLVRGAIRMAGERNWTPNQNLAGSIAENAESASILGDEYIYFSANDATVIADWYQNAAPEAVETLMVVEADITAERDRLLALWKTAHMVYGFDGFPELLAYEIGNLVTLTHPRFGLSGGVTGQIVGIKNDWITPRVSLEVLV